MKSSFSPGKFDCNILVVNPFSILILSSIYLDSEKKKNFTVLLEKLEINFTTYPEMNKSKSQTKLEGS